MSTTDWLVVAGGIAAIVWVNWYFFVAGRTPVAAAEGAGGTQQVEIRVRGGFDPATVRVRRGAPVRLIFHRDESAGGSDEVVLPDFGVRRFLAPGEATAVEFTPAEAGSYEFTCGMGLLRGRLVVVE
jgi:plastocyanin domain-containing protein